MNLVFSLFPGIGLLDMAFEEEGFWVVRGPDLLWGGDIRGFHPPAGKFDGVIGGPPCQEFSALAPLVRHNGHEPRFGNLIPEYERCVAEAQAAWFVMENVRGAPLPEVEGYDRWAELLKDSDVGGVQPRVRRISWGMREGAWTSIASPFSLVEYEDGEKRCPECGGTRIEWDARGLWCRDCEHIWLPRTGQSVVGDSWPVSVKVGGSGKVKGTLTTNSAGAGFGATRREPDSGRPRKRSAIGESRGDAHGSRPDGSGGVLPNNGPGRTMAIADMLEIQGLPRDYFARIEAEVRHQPMTIDGQRHAIGNGVPLPMGRAIARAVKTALDA